MLLAARTRRRGAAFLFFILVALPVMSVGAVLAVDVTRLIISSREVSNVAEAAAVAGSQQFQQNSLALYHPDSRGTAIATVELAASENVRAMKSELLATSVSIGTNPYGSERVSVTVEYRVTGLTLIPLASALLGQSEDSTMQFEITREADVCIPGQYTPTGGSCVRPR